MSPGNQVVTKGIVLSRTNFGEADRIITMLTPDYGKLRLMAKGVRKIKSKLAGGIELFSVSSITFLPGKNDIGTLISSRLQHHYGGIAKNIDRTMLGYELLKRADRVTEDAPEPEYFDLLEHTMQALESSLSAELLELWFDARLLKLSGHQPDLNNDTAGRRLQPDNLYTFDFDNMAFTQANQGLLTPAHIKLLRLVFGLTDPEALGQVTDAHKVLGPCRQLVSTMRRQLLRA